ncbi:hypothetical protein ACSVDA_07680 [Cytobacillus sp. Hm23]
MRKQQLKKTDDCQSFLVWTVKVVAWTVNPEVSTVKYKFWTITPHFTRN